MECKTSEGRCIAVGQGDICRIYNRKRKKSLYRQESRGRHDDKYRTEIQSRVEILRGTLKENRVTVFSGNVSVKGERDDRQCHDENLRTALDNAGYDFKTLIDEDIKKNKDAYDSDVGDTNIDFRRVRNIKVYLDRNVKSLSLDKDFNPGDIVVYKNHIAIASDKVNSKGENYIIHQHAFYNYEDDGLFRDKIIGHYRWEFKDGNE